MVVNESFMQLAFIHSKYYTWLSHWMGSMYVS